MLPGLPFRLPNMPPTLGPARATPPSGALVALTLVGSCVTVSHDSFPLPRSVWWPPDRQLLALLGTGNLTTAKLELFSSSGRGAWG